MAAFSVGSAPGWRGCHSSGDGARVPPDGGAAPVGAMLAAGSLWALWHGMEGASGAWCLSLAGCLTPNA